MYSAGYSDEEDDDEGGDMYGIYGVNFHIDGVNDLFNGVDDLFDDDELYDTDYSDPLTDDDSDFSDGNDRNKVFRNLQDSFAVLPHIEFQSESGIRRLPRVVKTPETYETLHQVNYI